MGHMRTQTIERTDTDERVDDGTDSDTPKFFHYVKKDKIAESAVMGTHVVALCGEVFPVTQGGQARLAGLPGLQADLRATQEVAPSAFGVVRGSGAAACRRRLARRPFPLSDSAFSSSHHRNRFAWVSGAGHSSWIGGVELGADHDREPEEEREQQERDRGRQCAVGVAGAGDPRQVEPQAQTWRPGTPPSPASSPSSSRCDGSGLGSETR